MSTTTPPSCSKRLGISFLFLVVAWVLFVNYKELSTLGPDTTDAERNLRTRNGGQQEKTLVLETQLNETQHALRDARNHAALEKQQLEAQLKEALQALEAEKESHRIPAPPAPSPTSATKAAAISTSATIKKLWLVTCQTKMDDYSLGQWTRSATYFRDNQSPEDTKNIHIINVCEGVEWKNFVTKQLQMQKFLHRVIEEADHPESNYIMFTDADAYFNPFAVNLVDIFERYEKARDGKPILVSGEPNCWVGRICNEQDMQEFYPDAGPRSNCPQFVNSGQYMGDVLNLKSMYNFTLSMDISARPKELQRSDQFRLAYYYSLHKDMVGIDHASSLFRNLMFGLVDSTKTGKRTCGKDAVFGCGQRKARILNMNTTSGIIEMDPVPGDCPMEVHPFNMHTAGGAKGYLNGPAGKMDKYAIERGFAGDTLTSAGTVASTKLSSSNSEAATEDLSIPDHFHMVFVGDSLTRYQYLSLAYYLARRGKWVPDDEIPSPLVNLHYKDSPKDVPWTKFFNASIQGLNDIDGNGREECDCFRKTNFYTKDITENRYFHAKDRDVHLTYLQKYGYHPAQGHWDASTIRDNSHPTNDLDIRNLDYNWTAATWPELIRNHIAYLEPKPQYVVLNAGLWDHDLSNETLQRDIREALDDTGIVGIYKTTTARAMETKDNFKPYPHEQLACEGEHRVFQYCQDLSWTKSVPRQQYVDKAHFVPSVYHQMSRQLFEIIQQIEKEKQSSTM